MPIGKFCQICGDKKKPFEVIGETHGLVLTAPCLMKAYGDPPWPRDQVRASLKYCALCGREQADPGRGYCGSCQAPLTAETGSADLDRVGTAASLRQRAVAFVIDLILIAVLCLLAFLAVNRLEASWNSSQARAQSGAETEAVEPAGEAGDINIFSVLRYGSLLFIFVMYHAIFSWRAGATPGKLAMGTRIVLENGSARLGFGRSLMRSSLYLFSLYVIPIGMLPLVFQEPPAKWLELIERDAMFHNSLTDTVVVRPGR